MPPIRPRVLAIGYALTRQEIIVCPTPHRQRLSADLSHFGRSTGCEECDHHVDSHAKYSYNLCRNGLWMPGTLTDGRNDFCPK